jgi:hypothetical protein
MNIHAFIIRSVAAALFGVLAFVGMIHSKPRAAVVSPAVVVVAENPSMKPIVTLPTIYVRPSTDEMAAALQIENSDFDTVRVSSATLTPASDHRAALPSFRLDMPYYSFGKALRHVSKD